MSKEIPPSLKFSTVVGYGTFITRKYFEQFQNVVVCQIHNYIRIYPEGNWFPYALPCEGTSFWALKFSVNKQELEKLDQYEGVPSGLYDRVELSFSLTDHNEEKGFIYIPSENTIQKYGLSPEMDPNDRWKEEIRKFPDIIEKYPELGK